MSDNILSAVLVFSLMAGGTAAIGSEMIAGTPTKTVTLAPVTVIGHRDTVRADVVTLPMVMVTGCRTPRTEVAVETHEATTRVE